MLKPICRFLAAAIFLSGNLIFADHHNTIKLEGNWKVKAYTDDSARDVAWSFKKKGGKLSGVQIDHEEGRELDFDSIVVKEDKVELEIKLEFDNVQGVIHIEGRAKTAGKIDGEWNIRGDDGTEYMRGEFTATKEVAFAGTWDTIAELGDGTEMKSSLDLTGKNTALKGVLGPQGRIDIEKISVSDKGIRLEFSFDANGNEVDVVVEAALKGEDELEGKWIVESAGAEGPWSAKRKPVSLAGDWNFVAETPNGDEYTGTLTLKLENGKYSGKQQRDNGNSAELDSVEFDGNSFSYTLEIDRDNFSGTVKVEARLEDDGGLSGEWSLTRDDGNEVARNAFKATRK